jgi:hypothetical protein
MILKSIHLKEGIFEREIIFSKKVNLIHSTKNSCGKTTLLRCILYALGYNIPNTKKIRFKNCNIKLVVECESMGLITLVRDSEVAIEATFNNEKKTFVLPEQQEELHKIFYCTENTDLLSNLLGAFYVDQEKGWTLLNRGVVIGSIHFNIEELIRGLSGCDCSELIREENRLERELTKYKQMFSVSKYQETLNNMSGELISDNYEDEIEIALQQLLIQKNKFHSEIKRIDRSISDNRKFKKYIQDMRILVEAPNGERFVVNEENIVGLNDIIDLLIAKRKMLCRKFSEVSSKIDNLEKNHNKENEQLSFYESVSQIERFDEKIARIHMNPVSIKKEIKRLEREIKSIRDRVSAITKNNNNIVSDIANELIKYAEELGLGDKETINPTYLFTSNLKELSGAVLHKTAFAFRLAYINVIESLLNIKLPIILDSPSGKEVDKSNIALMMDILKRDFSDNQIIIASIFDYDFDDMNIIEIKERLIDCN